jgi:hypothetical protein
LVVVKINVDNYRWVYFELEDGIKGWAPYNLNIGYETGI